MQRVDEGHREPAAIDSAAVVSRIDLLYPLARCPIPYLRVADEHRAGLLTDRDSIADVIVVPVRDQHMRRALCRLLRVALERGIARQERVDHHFRVAEFDAECGMPEPGQLHRLS